MSKGIGQNYINMMKRYHVPVMSDRRLRIKIVCDRAFYHDGAFKYKLPRYFRDRLYRKKCPFDAQVWNNKTKMYEKKIVYRYASKNPLSREMQVEIRNRILEDYNRRVADFKSQFPNKSDTEIRIIVERNERYLRKTRFADCSSKMSRFYNTQRFINRNF